MRAHIWVLLFASSACTAEVFIGPDPMKTESSSTSGEGSTSEGFTTKSITETDATSDATSDSTGKSETTADSSDKPTTTKSPEDATTTSDTKGSGTEDSSGTTKGQLGCVERDDWDCIDPDTTTSYAWDR